MASRDSDSDSDSSPERRQRYDRTRVSEEAMRYFDAKLASRMTSGQSSFDQISTSTIPKPSDSSQDTKAKSVVIDQPWGLTSQLDPLNLPPDCVIIEGIAFFKSGVEEFRRVMNMTEQEFADLADDMRVYVSTRTAYDYQRRQILVDIFNRKIEKRERIKKENEKLEKERLEEERLDSTSAKDNQHGVDEPRPRSISFADSVQSYSPEKATVEGMESHRSSESEKRHDESKDSQSRRLSGPNQERHFGGTYGAGYERKEIPPYRHHQSSDQDNKHRGASYRASSGRERSESSERRRSLEPERAMHRRHSYGDTVRGPRSETPPYRHQRPFDPDRQQRHDGAYGEPSRHHRSESPPYGHRSRYHNPPRRSRSRSRSRERESTSHHWQREHERPTSYRRGDHGRTTDDYGGDDGHKSRWTRRM